MLLTGGDLLHLDVRDARMQPQGSWLGMGRKKSCQALPLFLKARHLLLHACMINAVFHRGDDCGDGRAVSKQIALLVNTSGLRHLHDG